MYGEKFSYGGVKMANKVADVVYALALPLAQDNGYTVYEVEYKKEGADMILRVVLDSEDDENPVSITACENVSRALSEILDKNDPVSGAYMLEVTSPGLDRPLKKDEDFVRFKGKEIEIGLYKAVNGSKMLSGTLVGLEDGNVVIYSNGENVSVPKNETSFVRLAVIF